MPALLPADATVLTDWTEEDVKALENALTRRKIVVGSLAASLAPLSRANAQGTPIAGASRDVVDKMGPVTIPANPQRVIANGNSTLGNMLALGVKPVGANVNTNSLPTYMTDLVEGGLDDIVDVTGEDGIDLEKALALDPDLIIAIWGAGGSGWNEEVVGLYKQAVATFTYEQNYVYEEDIKKNLTDVAYALNMEGRGDEVIAAFDARVSELREKVTAVGFDTRPVTVVRVFQDGTYSIRIGTSESIIFRALGIPQPEGQQNPEDFSIELSLERLDVLNQAYAVIVYIDDNGITVQDDILTHELWQSIEPVREGRVIFVNSGVWNSIEIPGAMAILDDVETLLLPLAE